MTHIDLANLEPAYRLLLTTDGTLTNMLEAVNLERICLLPLAQRIYQTEQQIDSLALEPGESVMQRQVLLKGERTGKTYVYADSLIAMRRLDARIREALLTTNTPIGRLWKENRIETFKEVLQFGTDVARERSFYFEKSADTQLLVRKSRVASGGKPVALITEHLRYDSVEQAAREVYPVTHDAQNRAVGRGYVTPS